MADNPEHSYITLRTDNATQVPITVSIEGGMVKMKILSEEQIATLSSNETGVTFNTLLAVIGLIGGLLGALGSGSIKSEYIPYFVIFTLLLVILAIY